MALRATVQKARRWTVVGFVVVSDTHTPPHLTPLLPRPVAKCANKPRLVPHAVVQKTRRWTIGGFVVVSVCTPYPIPSHLILPIPGPDEK